MASIVVSGDTSGAVTITAPAIAGTTTLTLPTTSGTILTTAGGQTVPFAAGTVSAPSITFTGDTNTGIYSPAADTIAFTEGGVESMRIDSNKNLILNGDGYISRSFGNGNGYLNGLYASGNAFDYWSMSGNFIRTSATSGTITNSLLGTAEIAITTGGTNQGSIRFSTGATNAVPTERMTILSNGDIGIGTNNPIYKLDILGSAVGNNTVQSLVQLRSASDALSNSVEILFIPIISGQTRTAIGGVRDGSTLNAHLYFSTNNTERMRITSDGKVLVGGTSAVYGGGSGRGNIEINGSSDSILALTIGGSSTNASYFYNTTSSLELFAGSSRSMNFTVNGAERMRITSGGDVLINTNTKGSNTSRLYVNGAIGGEGLSGRQGSNGTSDGNNFNFWWTGTQTQLWVDTVNTGVITVTSDYRVKRNIQTQTAPAIVRVMALRPVTYQPADYGNVFKATDDVKEGFIAHEVQEVIPSGADGIKDDPNQIQSLRLDAILAVAIKAIQELNAKVEAQAAEIKALKGAK